MKPTLGHSHETSQDPQMEFPSREGNHPLLIALVFLIAAACITLAVYEFSKQILFPVPEHPRRPSQHQAHSVGVVGVFRLTNYKPESGKTSWLLFER